jgi:salicylate hydroxylase
MPAPGRTVFIAGAGIAGLTLALSLARSGSPIVILEREPDVSAFGAGLQISPNARRILDRLGLGDEIAANALEPDGIAVYHGRDSRPFTTLALGPRMRERFGAPYAVMHRADLNRILHKACRRFANIDLQLGVDQISVRNEEDGVLVSSPTLDRLGRSGNGRVFIGADGVHSPTRRLVLKGPDARATGRTAWRALVPVDALPAGFSLSHTALFLSRRWHLVAYPLPTRGVVNLALFAPDARTGAPSGPAIRAPRQSDSIARQLIAAADGQWTPWPLYSVETPNWHQGAIGLIGDAAHAMLPFQAQGAAMTIEDAAVLGALLGSDEPAVSALARYSALRQSRVRRVQQVSRRNGKIFHMGRPLSYARDLVMRAQGPDRQVESLAWLYEHDVAVELGRHGRVEAN